MRNRTARRTRVPVSLLLPILLMSLACSSRPHGGVWHEDFEDASGWKLRSDAVADTVVVDGALRIHVRSAGHLAWATSVQSWKDFELQVKATQVEGPDDNEYGVLTRIQGDQDFYAFSISGDGYVRVARCRDGVWVPVGADWVPSEAVHTGTATNVLTVRMRGTTLEFDVNGVQVARTTDATFEDGYIGLYAGSFSQGDVAVTFDDLVVTPFPKGD